MSNFPPASVTVWPGFADAIAASAGVPLSAVPIADSVPDVKGVLLPPLLDTEMAPVMPAAIGTLIETVP